jgi:DNA-binding NtrC family response regulator
MLYPESTFQKLCVLVVEDHAFLRKLLMDTLQQTHEVHTAPSVRKGWGLYLRHVPDSVFVDINLPDASGHMLARRIKERQPYCYVVMATASDDMDDMGEAEKNLVNGFIVKPFDKKMINAHIDKCLAVRHRPS